MRAAYRDQGRTRRVEIVPGAPGAYRVRVDDAELALTVERLGDGRLRIQGDGGETIAEVTAVGARRFVTLGNMDFVLEREGAGARRARGPVASGLESPMPGTVSQVLVAAGAAVTRGQPLVAVEAMKMEHVLRAPRDGTVRRVAVTRGQMVDAGATLVELEDEEAAS
jgi:3-methylcrotonyl-CoA carboxylase alpha subunit